MRTNEPVPYVFFVPALTGLGAPWWDPYARGTVVGLSRGTTKAHVVRATVEAIAFQCADVLDVMRSDAGLELPALKVDGAASAMDLLLQFQADLLGVPVRRSAVAETTAIGAAYLAGLAAGVWASPEELAGVWRADREFAPGDVAAAAAKHERWRESVRRSLRWADPEAPGLGDPG